MSGLMVPKRRTVPVDASFGVCVWQLPDGSYIKNEDGDYFCAQGKLGNPVIERKMRDAVRYDLGITSGKPVWFSGFRKVTQSEWEDQMERLIDGKVPDAVDLYLQNKENNGES